jgi:hypothetical protein
VDRWDAAASIGEGFAEALLGYAVLRYEELTDGALPRAVHQPNASRFQRAKELEEQCALLRRGHFSVKTLTPEYSRRAPN